MSWPAPHDPAEVVKEKAEIIKSYGVKRISGDKYVGAWTEQEFRKHGITYEVADALNLFFQYVYNT